jgi:hypothetical protein
MIVDIKNDLGLLDHLHEEVWRLYCHAGLEGKRSSRRI